MDLILDIFKRLELDKTVFAQFAITLVLFYVLNQVFFKKLLQVIKLRQDKTEGLEHEANATMAKAENMAKQYKEKMDSAFSKSQAELKQRKKEIIEKNEKEIEKFVQQKQQETETEWDSFNKSFMEKKESVIQKADELSKQLLEKLVQ